MFSSSRKLFAAVLCGATVLVSTFAATPEYLNGSTVLIVDHDYYDDFAVARALTFSGTPSDGSKIVLRASVSAESTLTFPSSYRLGMSSATDSLLLPPGHHELSWVYADNKWWLADSAPIAALTTEHISDSPDRRYVTDTQRTIIQTSTASYTTTEKTKLAGVASGATANSTDAQLRDRATHTNTQPINTVTGLQTELDSKLDAAGSIIAHGNAGNGLTLTWSAGNPTHTLKLNEPTCTITLAGFPVSTDATIKVKIVQDIAGGRTVTFSPALAGGGTPVLNAAANGVTWFQFWSDDGGATIFYASTGAPVGTIAPSDIDSSAELRSIVGDASGNGPMLFQGGNIGAGYATTPASSDNSTRVATTQYVQDKLGSFSTMAFTPGMTMDFPAALPIPNGWAESTLIDAPPRTAPNDYKSITFAAGSVATPTFQPSPGEVEIGTTITFLSATPGASFRYTTTGIDPTRSTGIAGGSIVVTGNTTFEVVAHAPYWKTSEVATATYTIPIAYVPKSALFAVNSLQHNAPLSGVSDGKTATFSVWYDPTGTDGIAQSIFRIASGVSTRFSVGRNSANVISVGAQDSGGDVVLAQTGQTLITSSFGYAHIVFRCNLANDSVSMWINGVPETLTDTTSETGEDIDFAATAPIQYVGESTTKLSAHLADLWFDDSDLGTSAHLLFGKGTPGSVATWRPKNLGGNGSATGTAPALYLSAAGNGASWMSDSSPNGNDFALRTGNALNEGSAP